jgi:hypothetical protein
MIKEIITLLSLDDWIVGDEDIDIAKGKYELTTILRKLRIKEKRKRASGF